MWTVLLADDEEDVHDLLRQQFSTKVRLVSAFDGVETLQKFTSETPDLVVLDLTMPRLPGKEVLRRLIDERRKRHFLIVVLSARVVEDEPLAAREFGVDAYVSKPTDMMILARRIEALLAH